MTLTIAFRRPTVALFPLVALVGLGGLPSASAYSPYIEARCSVAFENSQAANSCETSGSHYTMTDTGNTSAQCKVETRCPRQTSTSSASTSTGSGLGSLGGSEGDVSGGTVETTMVHAEYTGSRDDMTDLRNCDGELKKSC